jgi:hypothetical protein
MNQIKRLIWSIQRECTDHLIEQLGHGRLGGRWAWKFRERMDEEQK